MKLMLKGILILAAVATLAMPASADTACAATTVCTVTLTQTNVTQLSGIVVTVTIDNTGSNTILSFQLTSNPYSSTNTALGIDMAGWNVGGFGSGPSGWSAEANKNLDGFGNFVTRAKDSASTSGINSALTFTLSGLVTNFTANASGNEFAVHIRFTGNGTLGPDGSPLGCSTFVGGQTGTASRDSEAGCGTPIPEPGTLALFGTGLLGLAGIVRRRLVG